jgi:hypothetical protein
MRPRSGESWVWKGVRVQDPVLSDCRCYLSPEGRGLISCPSCGFGRTFDFKQNIPASRTVMVRCKCGKQFEAFLEVRQHYRKRVKLFGQYTNLTNSRSGRMIIEDLSQMGIGLRIMGGVYFEKEDLVKVTFELDNGKSSLIVLKALVRHVRKNFVGCRILEFPEGQKAGSLHPGVRKSKPEKRNTCSSRCAWPRTGLRRPA